MTEANTGMALYTPNTLQRELYDDKMLAQLGMLGMRELTPTRLARIVLSQFRKVPRLYQCDPLSILASFFRVAELDLEPDGRQAALVPFYSSKRRCYECTLIVGYPGYIRLALRHENVIAVEAHLVYPSDEFELQYGSMQPVRHVPNYDRDPKEQARLGYMLGWMIKGRARHPVVDWMTFEDIEKRRRLSPNYSSPDGPHQRWPDEMRRNAVLKHGLKYLPQLPAMSRALTTDDQPDIVSLVDIPNEIIDLHEHISDQQTIANGVVNAESPPPEAAIKAHTNIPGRLVCNGEGPPRMPMPEPQEPIEVAPISSAPPSPDQAPAVSGGIGMNHSLYREIVVAAKVASPERRNQARERFALNVMFDVAKLDAETAGELLAFLQEGVTNDSEGRATAV